MTPRGSEESIERLLDLAFAAESGALRERSLRRVRALSHVANAELEAAAHEGTAALRLATAHPALRAVAFSLLPADLRDRIAARVGRPGGRPPSVPVTDSVARVGARAVALGAPGFASSRGSSEAERALASRLLALTRQEFAQAARSLGLRELRWMCGLLDRASAVRLLARLGEDRDQIAAEPAAQPAWHGDLDEASSRLASVALTAAGCDVAFLLGCSLLDALLERAGSAEYSALRSRMPPAIPKTVRPIDCEMAAALEGAAHLLEARI